MWVFEESKILSDKIISVSLAICNVWIKENVPESS